MRDLGVIFSGPMVRALIEDRKTQTRHLATSPLARLARGDSIYVRENFHPWTGSASRRTTVYVANGEWIDHGSGWRGKPEGITWCSRVTPSIHMPRWRSRLTLIVLDVRSERLHEISEGDALAEGVDKPYFGDGDEPFVEPGVMVSCRMQYRNLWNTLHNKEGQRWDDNPEVVAVTFRLVKLNIDHPGVK